VPRGPIGDAVRRDTIATYARTISDLVSNRHVDVVHMHGVDFAGYLPPPGPALAVTLHLSPPTYPAGIFTLDRPRTHFVCVSKWQMESCPPSSVPISLVANGVLLDEFAPTRDKGDFALALGRICPEKGFHIALDAAKRASMPLLLAGTVFPYPDHVHYFRNEIVPRLDDRRRFIGAIGRRQKRELIARASCVVLPSFVEETSSLVAMEALASGTPVIARQVGALHEVLQDGVTGYFAADVEDMADAMTKVSALSSGGCRREAERRFSARAMGAAYLDLFARLAARA
jgi:glycosyltransferase involved in cell wall biosynthesis